MNKSRGDLYQALKDTKIKIEPIAKRSFLDYSTGTDENFNERERNIKRLRAKSKFWGKEPMIKVFEKIKAHKELTYRDLRKWTLYNSKVLPTEAKSRITLSENRVLILTTVSCFTFPPIVFALYIASKRLKNNFLRFGFNAGCGIITICWVGALYLSHNHLAGIYRSVYNQYKDYVDRPEFITSKITLKHNKIDIPYAKFTSPSLMEMQRLLYFQLKDISPKLF